MSAFLMRMVRAAGFFAAVVVVVFANAVVAQVGVPLSPPFSFNTSSSAGGGGTGACTTNTAVLFNTSNAIACDTGLTYLGTGQLTITNSTANTTPLTITGGSITGSSTVVPGAKITATANTSGVIDGALLIGNLTNTASGAGTTLLDLQTASTSRFAVTTSGATYQPNATTSGYYFGNGLTAGMYPRSLSNVILLANSIDVVGVWGAAATPGALGLELPSATAGYMFGAPNGAATSGLYQAATGVVEVGSGTGINSLGALKAASYQAGIVYSAAGTALPSCVSGLNGARAFVSDSTVSAYGTTYTSGGANNEPVFCNGANWTIGEIANDNMKDAA